MCGLFGYPLRPFEETDQLPVRHAAVVFGLFPASGVEVVVDDVVAEGGAQHFGAVERRQRLAVPGRR